MSFFLAPAPSPGEAAAAGPPTRTVVCFGDSNTFGQSASEDGRLPYASRWTTALQGKLGAAWLVIPEGLNGRTTVVDDAHSAPDFGGVGGEGLNGRRYLLPCLHSHKPVDAVVLALGCNDLKARLNLSANDIAVGMRTLVADIRRSNSGPALQGGAPCVVVVSPPLCRQTADNTMWGFEGCGPKSKATIAAYRDACREDGLTFVDLSSLAAVGADGIHFDAPAAEPIAAGVHAALLREASRI